METTQGSGKEALYYFLKILTGLSIGILLLAKACSRTPAGQPGEPLQETAGHPSYED
jgi:hypothetical protein